jgi:hypothetical protein
MGLCKVVTTCILQSHATYLNSYLAGKCINSFLLPCSRIIKLHNEWLLCNVAMLVGLDDGSPSPN